MRKLWRNYSLSIVLAVLFIASWLVQTVAGWIEFVAEQSAHDATAHAFGPDGYVWTWAQATFENWQSEFLQLFTFVVLTTFLIHRDSHESRDSNDKMQASIQRIETKLDALGRSQS